MTAKAKDFSCYRTHDTSGNRADIAANDQWQWKYAKINDRRKV